MLQKDAACYWVGKGQRIYRKQTFCKEALEFGHNFNIKILHLEVNTHMSYGMCWLSRVMDSASCVVLLHVQCEGVGSRMDDRDILGGQNCPS